MSCWRLTSDNSDWLVTDEMVVRTNLRSHVSEAFVLTAPPRWHQLAEGMRVEFTYSRSTFEGERAPHDRGWMMSGLIKFSNATEINNKETH